MKRPIGLLLVCLVVLLACASATYVFRPWLIAAAPLAIVSFASVAAYRGVALARHVLALTLTCVSAYIAWRITAIHSELKVVLPEWNVWRLWPAALAATVPLALVACLFAPSLNRYFAANREPTTNRPTLIWSGSIAFSVVFLFVFFYQGYPALMGWPRTLDEAAGRVVEILSEEDRLKLAQTPEDDLIEYHFGLGMFIRNEFGLWGGNSQLLRSTCGAVTCHPDDASMRIIEQAHEILRKQEKR